MVKARREVLVAVTSDRARTTHAKAEAAAAMPRYGRVIAEAWRSLWHAVVCLAWRTQLCLRVLLSLPYVCCRRHSGVDYVRPHTTPTSTIMRSSQHFGDAGSVGRVGPDIGRKSFLPVSDRLDEG